MLSEFGNFFLAMAFGFSSVQVLASFWGVFRNACLRKGLGFPEKHVIASQYCHPELVSGSREMLKQVQHDSYDGTALSKSSTLGNNKYMVLGRAAAFLQGGFVATAFLTLIIAFLICDFSLLLVTLHDHTQLPWYYRFAATWGNHEGSLLLFVLILSGIGVMLAAFLPDSLLRARALTIQGLLTVLFIIFLVMTSNPFTALPFVLPEGKSLNPLLQDKGLLIHPPLLYLGYVGFSAPFSLAIAALWGKEDVTTWGAVVRPWALFAWGALTAGITLGSWWAYYELGWGGWWFWDPVENASFMPWLAGTALLHTLLTKKLYKWSLFLSLLTFGLSLLGTFLVRSGLIVSVHSFAQDPERGLFILSLIGGIMGFAFFMWAWKAPRLNSPPLLLFSRQGALLLNSLLLSVGLITIILGTLYPLWNDFVGSGKLAIGAPYFERTFIPLMIPLFLLIPVGSLLREEKESLFSLLIMPLTATLGVGVLLLYVFQPVSLWAFTGIGMAIWVMGGTVIAFIKKRLSIGPTLAHLGVALFLLGMSVGGGFRIDETRILGLKESMEIGGIKLTLQEVQEGKGPTYLYEKAILTYPGGVLTPEKRLYQPQNSMLSETAIVTNGLRDLYVILGPYQGENKWLIRASTIPLAPWIWIGGALMVLGAFLSLFKYTISYRHREAAKQPWRSRLKYPFIWAKSGLPRSLRSLTMTVPKRLCERSEAIQKLIYQTQISIKKKRYLLFLLFLLPSVIHADETLEKRANALSQEVRCPVCLGQSIAESETEESEALKIFIQAKLKEGESEEAIRETLRTLYGDEILFRPPFENRTIFLWLAPFGFFFLILMILLWKIVQSRVKRIS